jgi:hypothetical protein
LTSGERFLIGIVGQTILTRYGESYSDSPLDLPDRSLDMSKVNSITMTYTAGDTRTNVSAFGTVLGEILMQRKQKHLIPIMIINFFIMDMEKLYILMNLFHLKIKK